MRELLSNISLLRKAQPPVISARDFIEINHASFVVAPAFMVDVLDSLYQELRKQKRGYRNDDPPRVLLAGPNLAIGDYKVVDLIEEAGGAIVAEEICEGMRHYWDKVEEDNGNLLEALGQRYFTRRLPGAFQMPSMRRRFSFLENLAREYAVDGIVWYQLKNCETYDLEAFYLNQKLMEVGIPMLNLESEYQAQEREGFRTRIETFIETIRRK
jgi:benzoyl-CoA reductase/2-hydroxyglutaryl-CoA dehydratase subunit BcrC/BadD/HgdB